MSFEVFTGHQTPVAKTDPMVTVRSSGKGYLNRAADQRWFADADEVNYLVDYETAKVAIAPGDRGGRCYSLHREGQSGTDIALQGVLSELDIDTDSVDLPQWFDPVWDDDLEAAVVDLSTLREMETPDSEDLDASNTDGPEAVAYWLGLTIAPGQTRALEAGEIAEHVPQSTMKVTHDLREIDEDDDEFSIEYQEREGKAGIWRIERADEGSEADTAEAPTKTEQARVAVTEDGVTRLTELADRLEVTPGTARSRAMDADVYSRLRDDDISRPGVDR